MHRSLRHTTLCAALAATTILLAASRARADGADYLPLTEGATWQYETKANETTGTMTVRATNIQQGPNDKKAADFETSGGAQVIKETLGLSPEGLVRISYQGQDFKPPLQVLRLPVKNGDTWNGETTIADQKLSIKYVETADKVTVPAGTFDAVLVTSESDAGGAKVIDRKWYASGTGMVKEEMQLPGVTVVMELKKYEPGK